MNVLSTNEDRQEANSLMTAEQIAARWNIHRDTVYRLLPSELPFLKLGPKTRRYRLGDVMAYEQRCLHGRR